MRRRIAGRLTRTRSLLLGAMAVGVMLTVPLGAQGQGTNLWDGQTKQKTLQSGDPHKAKYDFSFNAGTGPTTVANITFRFRAQCTDGKQRSFGVLLPGPYDVANGNLVALGKAPPNPKITGVDRVTGQLGFSSGKGRFKSKRKVRRSDGTLKARCTAGPTHTLGWVAGYVTG